MWKFLAVVILFNMLGLAQAIPVDSVLSVKNGIFFFEGKPFGEISFNKFDLFWQLWDEAYAGRKMHSRSCTSLVSHHQDICSTFFPRSMAPGIRGFRQT